MPEVPFTQGDIEELGRKLSGLGLQGTEKALFNAVLALADNSLRTMAIPVEHTEPSTLEFDDDVESLPDPGQAFAATMAAPPSPASPTLSSIRGISIR